MRNEPDSTQWSLPGPADAPRDDAQAPAGGVQGDHPPAGLRERLHLGADRLGGRHRQRIHPAPGVLLGAPAPGGPLVEPGRDRAGGGWRSPQVWSVALQREAFKPPARLRLPMPGLVFVCSPGRSPWAYAATSRPTDPEQHLFRAPGLQRLRRRAGLSRKPPVPRGGGADTGVLLLPDRRHPGPLEEAYRQPASAMGGA